MCDQLDNLRRERENHKCPQGGAELQLRLCSLTEQLHSQEGVVGDLKGENEGLRLERDEVRAELEFVRARVKRLERLGMGTPDVEGSDMPLTGSCTAEELTRGVAGPTRTCESHALNTHAPVFYPRTRSEPTPSPVTSPSVAESSASALVTSVMSAPETFVASAPSRVTFSVPKCISATPAVAPTSIPTVLPPAVFVQSVPTAAGAAALTPAVNSTIPTAVESAPILPTVAGPATMTPTIVTPMVPTSAATLPTAVRSLMPPIAPTIPAAIAPGTVVLPLVATASVMPTVAPPMWASGQWTAAAVDPTPVTTPMWQAAVTTPLPVVAASTQPAVSVSQPFVSQPSVGTSSVSSMAGGGSTAVPSPCVGIVPEAHRLAVPRPNAPTSVTTSSTPLTSNPPARTPSVMDPPMVMPRSVVGFGAPSLGYPSTLANLLPQIQSFNGQEQRDGETVQDWVGHFESVAGLAGWNDHFKLVHLTSALRGAARSFYHSCTPAQRSNYHLLVAELKKRFTPVQLTAVQTQLFHSRRQGNKESVDDFAQELRKLHAKAYSAATFANPEAEKVGQMVLANQFISGLRPELQAKVVGMEGTMDVLVLKARFEEAKARELAEVKMSMMKRPTSAGGATPPGPARSQAETLTPVTTSTATTSLKEDSRRTGPRKCYNCGLEGHVARTCSYTKTTRGEREAHGKSRVNNVTTDELGAETTSRRSKIAELRQELHGVELEEAIEVASGVLGVIKTDGADTRAKLGPTVFAPIAVNGVVAKALVDTGSPATLISLDFILQVFAEQRDPSQTVRQWKEEVRKKFLTPSISLQNYGGHRLDVLAQVYVTLSQGNRHVNARVFVQKNAPNELLIGTDVQACLGFSLNVTREDGKIEDLLDGQGTVVTRNGQRDLEEPSPTRQPGPGPAPLQMFDASSPFPLTSPPADQQLTPAGANIASSQVITDISPLPGPHHPNKSRGVGSEDRQWTDRGTERPSQPVPRTAEAMSETLTAESVPSPRSKKMELCSELERSEESPCQTDRPRTTATPEGEVRLLKATKIPARHRKLIRGTVDQELSDELLLFSPDMPSSDILLVESTVTTREDHLVTLVVENHGYAAVRLKKGVRLGTVTPVELVPADKHEEANGQKKDRDRLESVCRIDSESLHPDNRVDVLFEQLKLDLNYLDQEEQQRLRSLLTSYSDVFALGTHELGTTDLVTHTIDTGDHRPVRQPPRRTPYAIRAKVDQLVKDMLQQKVIEPSCSPWASPIVLVQKKDGGVRFCVDYRKLNSLTKMDEFPLPRIDDTLDLLVGQRYFTTLDLASGYWQVEMEPLSKEKTAFVTYSGLYQFVKMPFGLANAPATFQRLMEVVLVGLAQTTCVVYLDDILVFGRDMKEHNANLELVLERLRRAGLRLKPTKCHLAREQVEYLGHIVSAKGVQTDPKKLEAVERYPRPTDVKTLRSFVGLASYYRRFIPKFATVAHPLHFLTKKDAPFVWTSQCQVAFENLKKLLTSSPVLAFPQFDRPFILETDASGTGLGAVLAQKQDDGKTRPIAYASRTLQPHEKKYGATEMEGLGVVWAVKHFRPYLYGHACEVYTDHSALTSLLNTLQPSGKLARWGMAIQELDITIHHRAGSSNGNADALSRAALDPDESVTQSGPDGVVANLGQEVDLAMLQRQDEELMVMIDFLETGLLPSEEKLAKKTAMVAPQYTMEDGVLYHVEADGTVRLIPPVTHREHLFEQAHSGVFGSHLSEAKVYSELRRHYWWERMRGDVSKWTRGCLVCATRESSRVTRAPLTPIAVSGPFDRIGVDVIQFPKSRLGNQYAVVFVDYLTKWPEAFPVQDQTAATIAHLLVTEIVSRHGVPTEVLSDRGCAFLSGLMKEVEKLLGFHKVNTSAYHPQTDGLVERFNRTLTAMLAKTVEQGGKDWDQRLPYVLFAYRASQHQSMLESPFYLLYGRDPRLPTDAVLCPVKARKGLVDLREYGRELTTRMSEAWELARKNVGRAQKKQKEYYDQRQRPPNFRVGDRAFLFMPAEKTGQARKFARPYHGPYRILEVDVNTARIRRVDKPQDEPILVHQDRLRRCLNELADECWPTLKKMKGRRSTPCSDEPQKKQQKVVPRSDEPQTEQLELPGTAGQRSSVSDLESGGDVLPNNTAGGEEDLSTNKTDFVELLSLVGGEEDPVPQIRTEANLDEVQPVDTEVDAVDTDARSAEKLTGNQKRTQRRAVAGGRWSGCLRSTRKKSGEDA